jgi:hypothetical protein
MTRRVRRSAVVLPITALALAAWIPAASEVAASSRAHSHGNANFKGHWHLSNGQDFTVTTENVKTGRCKGRTSLGPPYKFSACEVKGNHYSFHITDGPGYTSKNAGHFTTHELSGHWHDNDGASGTYTATRGKR